MSVASLTPSRIGIMTFFANTVTSNPSAPPARVCRVAPALPTTSSAATEARRRMVLMGVLRSVPPRLEVEREAEARHARRHDTGDESERRSREIGQRRRRAGVQGVEHLEAGLET